MLHDLLAAAAEREPARAALVIGERTVAYRELDELASRVAGALRAAGVRRGDRVVLAAPKSLGTVAAIYGTLRAGAAYVPIDPGSPAPRAGAIARDAAPAAVVADAERWTLLQPELSKSEVVRLDVDAIDDLPASTRDSREPDAAEDDLAYVLYTSGSTGVPKGVMLSHRNALTFVRWAHGSLRLTATDRFSSHAPFHFDLSVFDLYACAMAGGTLVPLPEEAMRFGESMASFVQEHALTVWYSVPSALTMWVTQGGVSASQLASLRHVVFAGEVFPTPYLRKLRELVPRVELHNWYGPTETNVCTFHDVTELPPEGDESPIPIGRACEGYECVAVPAAGGSEEGELYVGGSGVMRGYWGQLERTREVLVPLPGREGLYYRTGDLVARREDGELLFRGRRDHQVKTRGYRVELGEVEAAIYADERVRETCVVAVPDERIGHALVAFVAPAPGAELSAQEVRRWVASRLPRYFVPATVHMEAELPKTSTGKIDRRALEERADG